MEHRFTGPPFTIGIEEELMIVDRDTLDLASSIEGLLEVLDSVEKDGEVKPELMESVCEIATEPCRSTREAGDQLRALRRRVQQVADQRGLAIGSAGTHPFALWEDQRIVSRPRYRELIAGLQFVARQEIIFGIHVHVGLDDPDKAIHVTNGMRVHIPILLALSVNSPFWRGQQTGLQSTRTPIFRAFPRVGIPPRYEDFEDWSRRIDFMETSKVVPDYTYLWYDVRPHPNFGTVEIRVMDSQTRVEHTLAIAALIQAMVKELAEHYDAGKSLSRYPYEMLDENKWLAARHGLEGELVDLPATDRVAAHGAGPAADGPAAPARRGARLRRRLRLPRGHPRQRHGRGPAGARLRGQPRSSGSGARDRRGQRARGRRDPRRLTHPAGYSESYVSQPDLFVVCRNCGSEVSPYVTECPYCGQRVRKRAPKLDRSGGEPQPKKRRRRRPTLPRLRAEEIAGIAPDRRPYATFALILAGVASMLLFRAVERTAPSTSATSMCRSSRSRGASSRRRSCSPTRSATRSWHWSRWASSGPCSSAASARCR